MRTQETLTTAEISRRGRGLLLAGAVALAGLLGVAGVLTPSAAGLGTHEQLGLPQCTFRAVLGLPCPTCGMTTSWACLVRGQVTCACRANLGGALLGVWAALASPWMLLCSLRGRWLAPRRHGDAVVWILTAIAAVTFVQWLWRLGG